MELRERVDTLDAEFVQVQAFAGKRSGELLVQYNALCADLLAERDALAARVEELDKLVNDLGEMAEDYLEDAFAMGDHCNNCGHDFALEASHCPQCGKAVKTEYENSVIDRYKAYHTQRALERKEGSDG